MKAAVIAILFGVLGGTAFASDAPEAKAILKSYQTDFVKMTKEPHLVNAGIYALCRAVPESELKKMSADTHGPHFLTKVDVYVNEMGAIGLKEGAQVLPVGTVIVKKKSKVKYAGGAEGVDGVGGMIKREAGYDPENGDWEYFYSDKDGNVTSGKMENCITCHQKAAETDFVFRTWLKPILKKQSEATKK